MFPASHEPCTMVMKVGVGGAEQKGGVSMLIVGVHLDASLPAWSGLDRQAIILHLLSSHYTPVFLSISVLPHCLGSALFPLHVLQYHLSPHSPPPPFIFLRVLLCYALNAFSPRILDTFVFLCQDFESGTCRMQSADVLLSW